MRTPTASRGRSPRNSCSLRRARSVTDMLSVDSNFAVPTTAWEGVVGGAVVAMDSAMACLRRAVVDEGSEGGGEDRDLARLSAPRLPTAAPLPPFRLSARGLAARAAARRLAP